LTQKRANTNEINRIQRLLPCVQELRHLPTMASLNTDPNLLPDVLKHLKPLDQDRYILAFGPEGKQFVATPNGYAA